MWALFAFVVALVLFWISTNQWALWIRGAIWLGGVVLLILAYLLIGKHEGGLFPVLRNLFANLSHPADSAIGATLSGSNLLRFFLSLLDFFIVLGVIIAIVAAIAFTPGEAVENALKPVLLTTLGAVIGGALAIVIVGLGLGYRGNNFSELINPNNTTAVVDADTLLIDGVPLRLRGVDAVERDQTCRAANGQASTCGEQARAYLWQRIAGATVTCIAGDFSDDGYRLADCRVWRSGDAPVNLAQEMVAKGWAVEYSNNRYTNGAYLADRLLAAATNAGVWPLCTPRPDVWRSMGSVERGQFRDHGTRRRGSAVMGSKCPRQGDPGGNSPYIPPPPGGPDRPQG